MVDHALKRRYRLRQNLHIRWPGRWQELLELGDRPGSDLHDRNRDLVYRISNANRLGCDADGGVMRTAVLVAGQLDSQAKWWTVIVLKTNTPQRPIPVAPSSFVGKLVSSKKGLSLSRGLFGSRSIGANVL